MKQQTLVSTTRFEAGVLPRRSIADGQGLSPGDPAILAVTDFTREHPVTIDPERQIDDALDDMIRMGVRALLVVRDQRIVGLITSYDIQGERPLQFLQSSTYSLHRDIRVAHIMTPWHVLTAINWETLQTMRAGRPSAGARSFGNDAYHRGGSRSARFVLRGSRAGIARAAHPAVVGDPRLAPHPRYRRDPRERHQQRTDEMGGDHGHGPGQPPALHQQHHFDRERRERGQAAAKTGHDE